MHSLVVGGVLLGVVGVLSPSDVGVGTIDAQVDGNAAGLVVQVDLDVLNAAVGEVGDREIDHTESAEEGE